MSGTYSNLIYHIVFSTKGRRQLITSAIEAELYQYMDGIIHNLEGKLLEINGVADHVHLLVKLKPQASPFRHHPRPQGELLEVAE